MWNFISHKCSFYVVYFSGLKYPLRSPGNRNITCYSSYWSNCSHVHNLHSQRFHMSHQVSEWRHSNNRIPFQLTTDHPRTYHCCHCDLDLHTMTSNFSKRWPTNFILLCTYIAMYVHYRIKFVRQGFEKLQVRTRTGQTDRNTHTEKDRQRQTERERDRETQTDRHNSMYYHNHIREW